MKSEELRRRAALYASPWKETILEAADEIDRLAKRVAELESCLRKCSDDCEWYRVCDVPKNVSRVFVQRSDGAVEKLECR